MFQFFQEHLKTIFLCLTIPIIVSFVFVFNINPGAKVQNIGELFGEPVKESTYQDAYRAVYIDAFLRFGDQMSRYAQFLNLEQQAWTRLMLLHQADKMDIGVDIQEVQEALIKAFGGLQGTDSSFDQQKYKEFITRRLHMTVTDFEAMFRDTLRIKKLREQVESGITITDDEVKAHYHKENDQLNFQYLSFLNADFMSQVEVSDEVLQIYLEDHPKQFQVPAHIKLRYVRSDKNKFRDQVIVPDSQVEAFYQENQDQYIIPETPAETEDAPEGEAAPASEEASPLRIKPLEEVRESIREQLIAQKLGVRAEEHFDQLYRQMIEQEDFQNVVAENLLSTEETEFFPAENPPATIGSPHSPQIREVFSLPESDFIGPYSHAGEWLIFQVVKKQEARDPENLEEVRQKVLAAYQTDKAPALAEEAAANMLEQIADHPEGLVKASEESGLTLKETGLITRRARSAGDLGSDPELLNQLFSMEQGVLSSSLSLGDNRGFVFGQVIEKKSADEASMMQGFETLREQALRSKQGEYFSEWFEKLEQEANLHSLLPSNQSPS